MVEEGNTGTSFMDTRIALGVGISLLFAFLRYRFPVMPKSVSNIGVLAGLVLIAYALISWLMPTESPLAKDSFPGFSSTFALKINDAASAKAQYIFEYQTDDAAKVNFHFSSAGDRFILQVTDIHGDDQSLDLEIGSNVVPINKFVFITCQIGLASRDTYLRVVINEKEAMSRTLPFRMDLGSRHWVKGTIGADATGNNHSAFDYLSVDIMSHGTLTDHQLTQILQRVRTYLRDIHSPVASEL
jgi:hypothetical protein